MRLPLIVLCLLISLSLAAQLYSPFRFGMDGTDYLLPGAMAYTNSNNLSAAVNSAALDTSFTFAATGDELSSETLFPAGSMGAAPICLAVLQLAERGRIDLEAPVNDYLKSTQLKGRNADKLTVRDLLLMKYRLGSGYKPQGHPDGKPLPNTAELVNDLRVGRIRKPEGNTEYGGFLVLQLLLEDSYGVPLNELIQREVFGPLGMANSFYASELTAAQQQQTARGHREDGTPIRENRRYAELSAMGLWTTPTDYVQFVRSVLDARTADDGIISKELAQGATTSQYGMRSLVFHVSENGQLYFGGNFYGYYCTMAADPSADWVSVVAIDGQLRWKIANPVGSQLGLLAQQYAATDRLLIFCSPDDKSDSLIREVEHIAFYTGVRTERSNTPPAGISGSPAFVFQNERGRSIYSGRHDDLQAIQQWLRSSRALPRAPAPDERSGLYQERGRQRIAVPIKYTSEMVCAADFTTLLSRELDLKEGEVVLGPLDRRVYLDLHPYLLENGDYQVTFSLFSQFDCHNPVYTNYGSPLVVTGPGEGLAELCREIGRAYRSLTEAERGFIPTALSDKLPALTWEQLGYALPPAVVSSQATATYAPPVDLQGAYLVTLSQDDSPGLFFSFPAPLDRYAGEVREMTGSFTFTDNGGKVAGQFDLPVSSIKTSSASLDTYVLGDILRAEKHPIASLQFPPTAVPQQWYADRPVEVVFPAQLTIRGREQPVQIVATFTPRTDGSLLADAVFALDFKQLFGREGPDGPEAIKNRLEFTAALTAWRGEG